LPGERGSCDAFHLPEGMFCGMGLDFNLSAILTKVQNLQVFCNLPNFEVLEMFDRRIYRVALVFGDKI
jgi:hypothetical protein